MKKKGFTLIELLVVIAVIALLLSIMVPALRLARDQAMVAVCSNDIRQQLVGFILYSGEYNNKIFGDYGWLDGSDRWKYRVMMNLMGMSTDGSILENNLGAPCAQKDIDAPKIYFCPSNVSRKGHKRQLWWDYDVGNCARTTFRIMGYQWTLDEDANPVTGIIPYKTRNQNMIDDNKFFPTRLDIKQSADVELVTDIAASDRNESKGLIFDIYGRSGGGQGTGAGMIESSSHVKRSNALYGMNVGFCDGHVQWRPFSEIKKRWAWGSGPWWWW